MSRIEKQLEEWDCWVGQVLTWPVSGSPEFDLYVKAFRLKRDGRCPHCGEKGLAHWRLVESGSDEIACRRCGWSLKYSDADIIKVEDPDDIILEAVRCAGV